MTAAFLITLAALVGVSFGWYEAWVNYDAAREDLKVERDRRRFWQDRAEESRRHVLKWAAEAGGERAGRYAAESERDGLATAWRGEMTRQVNRFTEDAANERSAS